jgi:hypothetical protein
VNERETLEMEMREKNMRNDEKFAISDGAKCEWRSSAVDLKQSSKRKQVNFPIAWHSNGLAWNLATFHRTSMNE